jgi:hypothetical protein
MRIVRAKMKLWRACTKEEIDQDRRKAHGDDGRSDHRQKRIGEVTSSKMKWRRGGAGVALCPS